MVYRPTVRYADTYKEYVNALFHATGLDRNQIIRAALFTAAHSEGFRELMLRYRKSADVPLPSPSWQPDQHGLWMEVDAVDGGRGGRHSNVNGAPAVEKAFGSVERGERQQQQQGLRRIESEKGFTRKIHGRNEGRGDDGGIRITLE